MVAPRAVWKGFLKVGSVACGVKIVGATIESSKIHFKILNRKDGLPVKSAYVDEETEETVDTEDQVKGFEIDKDNFIHIEPDEIKKLKLTSEHTLEIGEFIPVSEVTRATSKSPII